MKCHKIKYAAALLCAASVNANATLTSVDNGLGVYDSGINVTWTSDANLLGTMEANAIADGDANASNLITAIINASGGVIHDTPNYYDGSYNNNDTYSGSYALSAADFTTTGTVQGEADWWGQQAFVHYLDTINYGGSNQWALPTKAGQNYGYNITNSQLGELFYSELGGTAGNAMPANSLFFNEQVFAAYWSGTEYFPNPDYAWDFNAYNGYQINYGKYYQFYAWAVSPGQVNAVPVPGAVWLFGSGIIGMLGLKRRVHAG